MKCAIKSQKWPRFPCFAHALNLGVQAGLNASGVAELLNKAKSLVAYFKHSSVSYTKLKETATQLCGEDSAIGNCISLVQEVPTRWTSCYGMLYRLLRLNKQILALAADCDIEVPTSAQWKSIKDLCDLLEPLAVITEALGPTMSQVHPTAMEILQTKLNMDDKTDSIVIQNFKETMKDNINKHFLDDTQRCINKIMLPVKTYCHPFCIGKRY